LKTDSESLPMTDAGSELHCTHSSGSYISRRVNSCCWAY